MGTPRGGKAKPRHGRRLVALAVALACLLAVLPTAAGVADETTFEPAERSTGFYWSPSSATVAPGGSVGFRNPGKVVPHGLAWTGGPEKPSCSGIPVDSSGTNWSGTCSFAQAGTYTFTCTVHPEMQGTVTVAAPGTPVTPAPPPAGEGGSQSPLDGPPSQALTLARSQRGTLVRGSLALSAAASEGTLTVRLRAGAAALGAGRRGPVRVGRLVRSHLAAGSRRFAVPLTPTARRALADRGRLAIAVEIVVAAPAATRVELNRKVVLHA